MSVSSLQVCWNPLRRCMAEKMSTQGRQNSFKKFLDRLPGSAAMVAAVSNNRSSTLPSNMSSSMFYSQSSDCVIKKGWLKKQGGGLVRLWQNQWCVITSEQLMCYSTQDETKVASSRIFLRGHTITELPSNNLEPSSRFDFNIEPGENFGYSC